MGAGSVYSFVTGAVPGSAGPGIGASFPFQRGLLPPGPGAGPTYPFTRGATFAPGLGSIYSFFRGAPYAVGSGSTYSFNRPTVAVPGPGSVYSFINDLAPVVPPVVVPPVEEASPILQRIVIGSPTRRSRRPSIVVEPQIIGRYTGPGYPFGASEYTVLGPKPDVLVIVTSMVNIITTPKGTIPYAPQRGSIVPLLLFEPFTDVTLSLLRYYTAKDLSEQEPRIVVRAVFTERISDFAVSVRPSFQIVGDPVGDVLSAPLTFTKEQSF